jgi:hypothetical protein
MTVNKPCFPSFRVPVVEGTSSEAWGIEQGRAAFAKLDAVLRDRSEAIIQLDLAGVERLDVSCARELIANLIRKYAGVRWFYATQVANESVRENIDAAMLKSGSALLLRTKTSVHVLGTQIKEHLKATLDVVEKRGITTSKDVAAEFKGLALTACINRLKDLVDAGLIMRAEGAADSGGKEFAYIALR